MKCGSLVHDYLTISIPVLISDTLLGLGVNAVAMVMGRIGAAFVAANSITNVTQQLSTVLIQGISQAGCIVTGHYLGAGDYEKAKSMAGRFILGICNWGICGIIYYCNGRFNYKLLQYYGRDKADSKPAYESDWIYCYISVG